MDGLIYVLHFARPVGNLANPRGQAHHYLGWALDPATREREHRSGRGAALTRAAVEQGIDWTMFVLTEGTRDLERALKLKKATPRLCPICGATHPGGRLHLPPPSWGQLPLFDADDWPTLPAAHWTASADRYELGWLASWRRSRPLLSPFLAGIDTSGCLIPW